MKKNLSFLRILVLASLFSYLFAGCVGEDSSGSSTLNWNLGAEPKVLDPSLAGATDAGHIINNTFEGLVREQEGKVIPGMAESWEASDDGRTITFKIRRDAKWSDGSRLTANDFVYAWKRGMDPEVASEYAWIWQYTNVVGAYDFVSEKGGAEDVGVSALDDYTLEVKLIRSTDYFDSLMSFYHFMPVKKASVSRDSSGDSKKRRSWVVRKAPVSRGSSGDWAVDPAKAISNGPFKLAEYNTGDGLVLVKNENYWNKDIVKIDRINVKFVDKVSTAYKAYQAGDFDFLLNVPSSEVRRLMAENPEYYVFPLLGTYYYNFNLNLDVWKDLRVRKALSMAIDREKIVEAGTGMNIPATAFVPPGFPDHNGEDFHKVSGEQGLKTDLSLVEQAQKLLAEAGYPGGKGFPKFVLMYNTSEGHKQIAELVQEMWKTNLGIEAELENQEWAIFQDTRRMGKYEVSRGGWLTDFLDPMGLLAIFTSENSYNDAKFNNPEYDELMEIANNSSGKKHFEALYKAQEILMSEMPVIPVYHYTDSFLSTPKIKNWTRSKLGGMDFSAAWIEE